MDIYTINEWDNVLAKHLPEQGPSRTRDTAHLPKNDTLLVLANLPEPVSKKDHFTPARWWGAAMESCMQQSGFHMYGSVRILASLPADEMDSLLPRIVTDRKRPAILTENVALHTFEVASTYGQEQWTGMKQWDILNNNRKRVVERAAAQCITTPPGREPAPLILAPQSPRSGKGGRPYVPRASTEGHRRMMQEIEAKGKVGKDQSAKVAKTSKAQKMAIYELNRDNQAAFYREEITKMQMNFDERTRNLSRAAADPKRTPGELELLDKRLPEMRTALADAIASHHFRVLRGYDRMIDDARVASESNNFDKSVLLWDRRPFEPLRIGPGELFPRVARSMVYFEADDNPPVMQKLRQIPLEKRKDLMPLFEALSLIFSTRNNMTVAELLSAILPDIPTNDLVKSIPDLAIVAGKRLKPGCGPSPLGDATLDPSKCFQENIDYDLSDVRLRRLSNTLLWEILLEYQKHAMDLSVLQISRLLGGSMTSFRAGNFSAPELKLH